MRPALALVLAVTASCGDNLHTVDADATVGLTRAFRTADVPGCTWASPVQVVAGGESRIVIATTEGVIVAYDRAGTERWRLTLPGPTGGRAWLAATPAVVDDRLVVVWQDAIGEARSAHRAAVIDAATGALDPAFPIVTLTASAPGADGDVPFLASNNFSRSALVAARRPGDELGVVYATFGNLRDIQPWHGWIIALDLDAWRAGGDAIAGTLVTTPETDCGPPGDSGSDDRICGGGVWAPSGPTLVPTADSYELWVPTGNGQLDLARRDYANTVMRVPPDLAFDPGCDPVACASFDTSAPAEACMASCADLFMPRLRPDDPPLAPPADRCAGLTLLECYGKLDLDLGADSPTRAVLRNGRAVGVLPAKDGAVYLFDADHLGAMLDRLQVREFCGAGANDCTANWAGTMVTQPVVTTIDGTAVALVPTFYFDGRHPAGVVAIDLEAPDGTPRLRERWSAPSRDSAEAVARFREHTGRLALVAHDGVEYAVIADPGAEHSKDGVLFLIRVRDGAIVERGALDGPGHKYLEPLVLGDRVFVGSCDAIGAGPAHLEAWDLVTAP